MERKKVIIIIAIFVTLFLLIGGTFSWLTWSSENTMVIINNVVEGFSCAVDGGGDITSDEGISLVPSSCSNSNHTIKRELKTNVVIDELIRPELTSVYINLWLTVDSIGSYLINNENFKYVVTTSSTSCTTGIVTEGNFAEIGEKSQIEILDGQQLAEGNTPFYLYIWLDSSETEIPPSNEEDRLFSLSIGGSCADTETIKPNAPVLDNTSMIPVTIDNDGKVMTVSSSDSDWYDYDNKKWANAVLVKESGTNLRSYYLSTPNVEVVKDDILTYFVWIPRFKYKIWSTTTGSSPQKIDIIFEKRTSMTTGSSVDDYLTHPAFDFDGEKLPGFWVGKFETSHSSLSSSTGNTLGCTNTNCSNADGLIIKPDVLSKRNDMVSSQFYASRSMERSENPFGLVSADVDTHMMKNSEWGAVVYLSHSQYGINGEVRLNNSSVYTTGCGASEKDGAATSDCEISYGDVSNGVYPQSTTGNITGIFDMSGGANEYVMGYYSEANTNFGYTSSANRAGFTSTPESKYWDDYTTISSTTACNNGICFGHALSETGGWYDDFDYFAGASYPWFCRGGYFDIGSSAGSFLFAYYYGSASASYSWRVVLVV